VLVISVGYDAITMVLERCARTLAIEHGAHALHSPQSVHDVIASTVGPANNAALHVFGHGHPRGGLIAYCRNIVFDDATISLLATGTVSAVCCHGDALGAHARAIGFSILGFIGPLTVSTSPRHLAAQERALLAGPRELARTGSVSLAAMTANRAIAELAMKLFESDNALDLFAAPSLALNVAASW
jgi:hypothetical protein